VPRNEAERVRHYEGSDFHAKLAKSIKVAASRPKLESFALLRHGVIPSVVSSEATSSDLSGRPSPCKQGEVAEDLPPPWGGGGFEGALATEKTGAGNFIDFGFDRPPPSCLGVLPPLQEGEEVVFPMPEASHPFNEVHPASAREPSRAPKTEPGRITGADQVAARLALVVLTFC